MGYFPLILYAFQQCIHIAFIIEREIKEKKSKGPAFVSKEQRKRKKKQEVFQDEIKAAFVFI